MTTRQEFEMTEADLATILEACKPVPAIMLQCGNPPSPQENANRAWQALGEKMGFDHMSVEPVSGKGERFFTAEVKAVSQESQATTTTSMRKIVTSFIHPPIPCRAFDWSAHYDDEGEEAGRYGWGATEQAAIEDLKQRDDDLKCEAA